MRATAKKATEQTFMTVETANRLENIVDEARGALLSLDESEVSRKTATGKWSAKEILGHLLDSATNSHQRIIRAQTDRDLVFPGYDQEWWVRANAYDMCSWPELVVLWRRFNKYLADAIRNIPDEKLSGICTIGESQPVSLEFMIEEYISHMQHHLGQIWDLCGFET